MPTATYGLAIAMPYWALSDISLCFDLQEIDGRLYTDVGPTAADHPTLLRLAGLPEDAPIDIYLGANVAPLLPGELADLYQGLCVFYTPRHALPGAYYYLVVLLRVGRRP